VACLRRGARQGAARWRRDRPQSHRQSEKGAKRSLLCEAWGIPIGLATEGAHRHDQKLLKGTLDSIPIERPAPTAARPQNLCLDAGYDVPPITQLVLGYGLTPHIRSRGEEIELKQRSPDWRARRWVVERTHSWLNRNRGLLIRWSKKPENNRALHHLAMGVIAWRAALAEPLLG
jgi:putative transposase